MMFEDFNSIFEEDADFESEAVTFEDNEDEKYDLQEKVKINNILNAQIRSYTSGLQAESLLSSLTSEYLIIPKFQRKYVWNKSQVANLALSLIKDVPIPPFYLYINERKRQVVLDGQQRATSLFLYFNDLWYVKAETYNKLSFGEIDKVNSELKKWENSLELIENDLELTLRERSEKTKTAKTRIKELTKELRALGVVRTRFYVKNGDDDFEISFSKFTEDEKEFLRRKRLDLTIVECGKGNAPKVYAEIFKLLNSGGRLLSSQEIRNGIYWELELYDRLFAINKNANWRMIYGKESIYSKDVEILLKILALNYYSKIENDGIAICYEGTFNWSNIMEAYSDVAGAWTSNKIAEQIELLATFLDNIQNITADKKCNKAVFEAAFVAYTKLGCSEKIDYNWLCGIGTELEFQKGEVLSNKKSVQARLNKAYTIIKEKYIV